jgi:hypothetical protein
MDRLPDKFSPTKKLIKPLKAQFSSIIFLLLLLGGISNLVQAQSKVSVKD